MLFLEHLDELEKERESAASLEEKQSSVSGLSGRRYRRFASVRGSVGQENGGGKARLGRKAVTLSEKNKILVYPKGFAQQVQQPWGYQSQELSLHGRNAFRVINEGITRRVVRVNLGEDFVRIGRNEICSG